MRQKTVLLIFTLIISLNVNSANAAISPLSIPEVFNKLLKVPALSNPSMILLDETTGEVVYERNSNSLRKPASVMKLLSATATLEYLDPLSRFETKLFLGLQPKSLVIQGSYDPWISLDSVVAKKMHRTSLPYLAYKAMTAIKTANHGSLRNITVTYSGIYSQDVSNLKAYWNKRGFRPTMKAAATATVIAAEGSPITSSQSPTISEILDFTLLWSDNVLAERLARLSSRAAGYSFDDLGVSLTFAEVLSRLGIDSTNLVIIDASGLSKENRVTAQIIGQLLLKTRKDPKFALLYKSLPVSGISGTLKERFITTAPSAVGLIHAKTGTLNGTVTLAGYVESTDREYVFVTLADEIPNGIRAEDRARAAIDRLLGRIAAPNIEAQISVATELP
ncbi:unannotated protein [freshwater metagenome]|uniref:Unannotated protein n=2 Tax=freshwater metagenome TaxID=449393 RepID=A0A6J7LHJ4_9ZZZZ|nr:hypothetical protein [Actinomycetota bacterium]MSW62377.1 hypothetical protein [Actinomycetota bacterium]MSX89456.1 hypothetical protein [Actinomycetota bacterium]MSZ64331.1 hypothetical protein [Actinomycetota bacterium]